MRVPFVRPHIGISGGDREARRLQRGGHVYCSPELFRLSNSDDHDLSERAMALRRTPMRPSTSADFRNTHKLPEAVLGAISD
jgi:hypothetical protein